MTNLEELALKCHSLSLEYNPHKIVYQSVRDWFASPIRCDDARFVKNSVLDEMIARDTIYELTIYPDTPVGSVTLYHYDVEAVIKMALEWLVLEGT